MMSKNNKAVKQEGSGYFFNAGAARYRDKTGRFISNTRLVEMRNTFIDAQKDEMARFAQQLSNGQISRFEWTLKMRKSINETQTAEYLAGIGGRNNFTAADQRRLEGIIHKQYKYLEGFETDIQLRGRSIETAMSEAQIAERSKLYMEASTQAFEQAKGEARGIPQLPQYPGDGSTQCGTNCRCHWNIKQVDGNWSATWTLNPQAEHCPDCDSNSHRWAPLLVPARVGA